MDDTSQEQWRDPDAEDGTSPSSSLPGAGRRVDEAEREAALAAEPAGNAEVGDTVDTDELDSRARRRRRRLRRGVP